MKLKIFKMLSSKCKKIKFNDIWLFDSTFVSDFVNSYIGKYKKNSEDFHTQNSTYRVQVSMVMSLQ